MKGVIREEWPDCVLIKNNKYLKQKLGAISKNSIIGP